MRKPVAAVVTEDGAVVVVCDDGSLWLARSLGLGEGWHEQGPIPGSQRETEGQKQAGEEESRD